MQEKFSELRDLEIGLFFNAKILKGVLKWETKLTR